MKKVIVTVSLLIIIAGCSKESIHIDNDTLIHISVGYWGGTINYKLDIESIDSNFLKASIVYEDLQVLK